MAINWYTTRLKFVSSMKLNCDFEIGQDTRTSACVRLTCGDQLQNLSHLPTVVALTSKPACTSSAASLLRQRVASPQQTAHRIKSSLCVPNAGHFRDVTILRCWDRPTELPRDFSLGTGIVRKDLVDQAETGS